MPNVVNVDAPASKSQTYLIFRLGGGDVREQNLTKGEADLRIKELMAEKGMEPKSAKTREEEFQEIWNEALVAGMNAGNAVVPPNFMVFDRTNPLDDTSPVSRVYGTMPGLCGFAWVVVRPATSAFARWLKKSDYASPAYKGGLQIWISAHNQSVDKKLAHAEAMAEVFRKHNIEAYAQSRLD